MDALRNLVVEVGLRILRSLPADELQNDDVAGARMAQPGVESHDVTGFVLAEDLVAVRPGTSKAATMASSMVSSRVRSCSASRPRMTSIRTSVKLISFNRGCSGLL